jgi:hypothetical protein
MHLDHWKRTEYEPSSTDAANELGTISMTIVYLKRLWFLDVLVDAYIIINTVVYITWI